MAEVAGGIAPGPNRARLTIKACLRTEGGVLVEQLRAVVGGKHEREISVPDEAPRGIDGLKREAIVIGKTSTNSPTSLFLKGGSARRRDNLSIDGRASVCDVARRVAGRGSPQRDRGTDGERSPASQRRGSVFGRYDVSLHRVLGGIGRVARCHNALVERALGAVAVVAANAKDDGTLFAHGVVSRHAWTSTVVVC